MRKDGVCCIYLGTSHLKAGIIDEGGHLCAFQEDAAPDVTPSPYGTFDVDAYLAVVWRILHGVVAEARAEGWQISGVTVTNQRATVIPVGQDRRPLGPAISWQDMQGSAAMERFIAGYGRARFITTTGLPPSALWTLAKLLRLRERAPDMRRAHPRFVLLHDYTLAALGADDYYTDPSNASLTGLLELATSRWSHDIVEAAGLAIDQLPVLRSAGTPVGVVSAAAASRTGIPAGVPLLVGGGDQQCGALGIGALDPGTAGIVLGTAAVVSCPTPQPIFDTHDHLFCTAHAASGRWLVEGIHNTYGSAARWLAELLALETPQALDALAGATAPGSGGVYCYPFLAGIGSPDFDAQARGAMLGLELATGRAELARAVLEGTAWELRRILESIAPRVSISRIIVAGGGAQRRFRVQMLADCLGQSVSVSPTIEATLQGAALLAWTGLGRFANLYEAVACCTQAGTELILPRLAASRREAIYARYCAGIPLVRQCYQQQRVSRRGIRRRLALPPEEEAA